MNIGIIESKLDGKGGSQRQALSFAYALKNLGHEVTVYTLSYNKEKCFPEMLEKLRVVSVNGSEFPPRSIRIPGFGFLNYCRRSAEESRAAKRLAGLIASDTDVLNPHDRLGFRVAAYYKKMVKNTPSVLIMNDILTKSWMAWRKSQFDPRFRISIKKRLFNRLVDAYEVRRFIAPHERIVVLDNRTREWAREYFGKEARVVRSGLDLDEFQYKERRPLAGRKARVLATGVFFVHRRYEDAIEALALLKDKGYDVSLTIIGDYALNREYRWYHQKLAGIARERGIEDRVFFRGGVTDEELKRAYREHDIYVSPNHLQSWGLAAFEALASGMPAIISKTAGASEVLTNGKNALLVNPKAPQEIADAILRLIEEPELYVSLSVAGRKFVEENISWEKSARNLLDIFEGSVREKLI